NEVARIVKAEFPDGAGDLKEPLFDFVRRLSTPFSPRKSKLKHANRMLRMCYSYFATYGDPLLDQACDPYPDAYLARLSDIGINAIWLQGVIYKLAPYPFEPSLSAGYQTRLQNLNRIIRRAAKHGIRVFLYLNEPRAMPLGFFNVNPEIK